LPRRLGLREDVYSLYDTNQKRCVVPRGRQPYFFARKRELDGEVATNGTAAKHANFHCAFLLRTTWNAIRRTDLDGAADPGDV
jgi:hypothetical protein